MTTTALAGSTGLVGSNILATLVAHPAVSSIYAYTRRELPNQDSKLRPLISTDSLTWPSLFPTPGPSVFLSALGTTRAQAGGTDKQYAIDHDLNLALAQKAKEAGAKTYVLISTQGADPTSSFFYTRMKGEIEEEVKKLGFEHTVILRPGLIVGQRDNMRLAEGILRTIANAVGKISEPKLKDFWAQDAQVIGRAAVHAALQCEKGEREKGVWLVGQADVVRLGRTEWKE